MSEDVDPLKIQQFDQALELLEHTKKRVLNGEVMSVLILTELTSGDMEGSTTATENVFGVAGYMIAWAMRRMGFTQFTDVRQIIAMGEVGE